MPRITANVLAAAARRGAVLLFPVNVYGYGRLPRTPAAVDHPKAATATKGRRRLPRIPTKGKTIMTNAKVAKKQTVLFLCTHNSARSQMAEALLPALYPDRFETASAGVEPTQVHPLAIKVMAEIGIDLSAHRSKPVDDFWGQEFDYVVTVCDGARETCPFFPGRNLVHQSFDDPAAAQGTEEQRLAVFRRVRDEIKAWLQAHFAPERA